MAADEQVVIAGAGAAGMAVASELGLTVALDTALDPELELEGRVLDLIHTLNAMRRDAGLELTDRIRVTLPASHRDVLAFEEQIKTETLAVEVSVDGELPEPQIAKA